MTGTIIFGPLTKWSAVCRTSLLLESCLPWRSSADIENELARCFREPDAGIEAAFDASGRIVGAGCWSRQIWSTAGYSIHMAGVLPEWRGRGIGAQLVQRRLQAITEAAAGRPVWVDASTRCPARLERHGFVVAGEHDGLSRMTLRLPRVQACGMAA